MLYLGGKTRLGKKIAEVIERLRPSAGTPYLEPFVGGAGVTPHVKGFRAASDIDRDVVSMWKMASRGWVPPSSVTEEEYAEARRGSLPAHLTGFIKYACSWGAKPWGGYARGNREYARVASEGVTRKARDLQLVSWSTRDYREYSPRCSIVYCDPPYAGTTGYGAAFDHDEFWETMRRWSRDNVVVISEYKAPCDFKPVAQFPVANKLKEKRDLATETLWVARAGSWRPNPESKEG